MKNLLIIVFAVLSLSSCLHNFFAFYPESGRQTYLATKPQDIQLYSGDTGQDYIIIGSVASLGEKFLRKGAAKLGADAIIFLESNNLGQISGVAVRFKE